MAVVSRTAQSEALAEQIRRQRQALHLSLTEAAELAQVSAGFLSMLENGSRHQPGYDRLSRVAEALGLGQELASRPAGPAPDPSPPIELVSRLGACLVVARKVQLGDLARVTGETIPGVREGLRSLSAELSNCGICVIDSGLEAELVPLQLLAKTAAEIGTVRPSSLTEPRMIVIAITAAYGAVTRRLLEEIRGVDSAELLAGMVEDGYLEANIDKGSPGGPHVYRLTARTLQEVGAETVEELRHRLEAHTGVARPGPG